MLLNYRLIKIILAVTIHNNNKFKGLFSVKNINSKLLRAISLSFLSIPTSLMAADLNSVVDKALRIDPDVLEIANQRMSRLDEVNQAKAGYKPTIDMNAGYGYEHSDSPTTRSEGPGPHNKNDMARGEFGLVLTQIITDGHGTDSEVARQKARVDSSGNRLASVAESVSLDIVKAYLDVLRNREISDLSSENLETHKRIQDQIRLRSEGGVGRRADYDQINARVSLVEANLIAAKVNLLDANTNYKRRVGSAPEEVMESVPSVEAVLPGSVDDALEMALMENHTIKQAGSDIEATFAQNKAAKQFRYPLIYLELAANANNDLDGVDGHNVDFSAMVKMNYNLYNGGKDEARVSQTAYQIQEAQEIRNRSARQLEEELRLAWAAFEATTRQKALLEDQVKFSISTRDAYAKQFNIGQRTLLDLLNTDNELFDAKVSLAQAESDNLYAQYRILSAMGKMVQHLNVDLAELNNIAIADETTVN